MGVSAPVFCIVVALVCELSTWTLSPEMLKIIRSLRALFNIYCLGSGRRLIGYCSATEKTEMVKPNVNFIDLFLSPACGVRV